MTGCSGGDRQPGPGVSHPGLRSRPGGCRPEETPVVGLGHSGPGRFDPARPRRAVGRPDSGARTPRPGQRRSWSALVWSLRGSPHLHRRADLRPDQPRHCGPPTRPTPRPGCPVTPAGCWATGRTRSRPSPSSPTAMREVITAPDGEGRGQRRRDRRAPGASSPDSARAAAACTSANCSSGWPRCLPDSAWYRTPNPIVLAPLSGSPERPEEQRGLADVASQCYRQFGVGTPADVGAHLGTSATGVRPALPDDLVPVTVDGVQSRVPASLLGSHRRRRREGGGRHHPAAAAVRSAAAATGPGRADH